MKTCIFGGSFDPPTISHLFVINYLANKFDQVIIVPCFKHVFGKNLTEYHHRHRMLSFMIKPWSYMDRYQQEHSLDSPPPDMTEVFISSIEENLGGESIMARTIEEIRGYKFVGDLYFALGEDAYKDLDKWCEVDKLHSLATPYVLRTELFPNIHSTQIRAMLKKKEPAPYIPVRESLPYQGIARRAMQEPRKYGGEYKHHKFDHSLVDGRVDSFSAKEYLTDKVFEYIMENDLYI
jgi:cytidyltransferase-like protein